MIEHYDYTRILNELQFSSAYVSDVLERISNNDVIAGFYRQLFEQTGNDRYFALHYEVANCSKNWYFDMHRKLKIADLIRVQLCHNRFCPNCQKMIQATRLKRFTPVLLDTSDTKDLFHMVLTVPNVTAPYLRTTVSILFEAFARLVRLLRGTDKLRGVDLKPLGFSAALRNTEITFNTTRRDYHPHLHTIIAFDRGLYMPKIHRNKFSYDKNGGQRLLKRQFSDFELFLQKVWRLLVDQIAARVYRYGLRLSEPLRSGSPLYSVFGDGKPCSTGQKGKRNALTLDAVRALSNDDGYSVILDSVENGHFVQVFKYAFKLQSEDSQLMDFEQFETIRGALHGRKTIQGYGYWYNMQGDDYIDDSLDEFFNVFKAYLWQIDYPDSVNLSPEEVLHMISEGAYTCITRRKLQHILEDMTADELLSHKDEIPPLPKKPFSPPDLTLAYTRYCREKEQSELFGHLSKVADPDSGAQLIVLNARQLDFLHSIF